MSFAAEHSAIKRLRGMYPQEGPWILARRIRSNSFCGGSRAEKLAVVIPSGRTLYSIYSVIRRYDARRRQHKAA